MPEEQSSLRQAVDRILGLPPGGSAGTAGTQGQGGFDLAPKPSFFSDLRNLGTQAAITNTPTAAVTPVVAAPAALTPAFDEASAAWQSPADKARSASPASMFARTYHASPATTSGMNETEYIGSKLGGYDWRGKASQVGMLADEYWGGPNSSEQAYIASKLGGYDWRGKASQVGMLADEYRGGPMSSSSAYIASKLGGYDWRGKASDVGRLAAEYEQLNRRPA